MNTHTSTHTYIHTCIHTDRQTDRQIYLHTYIHTYIHTHIEMVYNGFEKLRSQDNSRPERYKVSKAGLKVNEDLVKMWTVIVIETLIKLISTP